VGSGLARSSAVINENAHIRAALGARRIRLKQVASACGISKGAVSQWFLSGPGWRPIPEHHMTTIRELLTEPSAPVTESGWPQQERPPGEPRQAAAPIGAAALTPAIPRRSRTEEPEAAGPSLATTDALWSAAFPGAGTPSTIADTLCGALGFPARHAAAGACL